MQRLNWEVVLVLGYLIAIPRPLWKLQGKKDRGGLFNNSCPPMDLKVPTTSVSNLTMGNNADVSVWASTDGVMKP